MEILLPKVKMSTEQEKSAEIVDKSKSSDTVGNTSKDVSDEENEERKKKAELLLKAVKDLIASRTKHYSITKAFSKKEKVLKADLRKLGNVVASFNALAEIDENLYSTYLESLRMHWNRRIILSSKVSLMLFLRSTQR